MGATILFVGREGETAESVKCVLQHEHGHVVEVCALQSAMDGMLRPDISLVLAHMSGKGVHAEAEIVRLLRASSLLDVPVPVVVLTEYPDAELALRMLRLGALECIHPPLDGKYLDILGQLWASRTRHRRSGLRAGADSANADAVPAGEFVVCGPALTNLHQQISAVAGLDSTVLLTGETGTGKTQLARRIHLLSPRRKRPFVVMDCGALSATLIESELFGHRRGAFTGADQDRVGKLASAGDGTLLLDEIDVLSPATQAKLLRVVEERVFAPVGSSVESKFGARLIAATNRSLDDAMATGRFRADLYYRLNVLAFQLPPLRDCPEAIPHLAERFLVEFARCTARPIGGFSPRAMEALVAFDWPGNVRELRNVVERMVALCPGPVVELGDLPEPIQHCLGPVRNVRTRPAVAPTNPLADARRQAEVSQLRSALARNRDNRTNTALDLGISRAALYKKLYRYGLQ
jgi:DNA-binding NtrC family response regulator